MKAYTIHNRSNNHLTIRSRLVPKLVIELKKDATHLFESEKEFSLFQDVVNIYRNSKKITLEVISERVHSAGIVSVPKVQAKVEAKVEAEEESTVDESKEAELEAQRVALKNRLEKLQSEYKSKETTKERKDRIKEEVNSIKKHLNSLKA